MVEEISHQEQSPQPQERPRYDLKYANRTLVLFSLLAAIVLYVDIMLTPSLPAIAKQYNVTSGQVSLILSLYTVFGTALNPIVGKLGDIYGKKKILTYVLIIYCVMVTTTSFAPDFNTLLISRTFQGIGLSIFPLAFSLVREQFPREKVPKAQGLLSAMFGVGTAVGLPAGAFIANSYGWQANYHIATPFIIVLTILIIIGVRESIYKNPSARLDYVGAILLGAALAAVVFGISEGSSWGWTSLPILGLIIGGLLLFIPLVPYERRKNGAILDFRLLGIRNVVVSNGVGLTFGLAMFLAFQAISYQLELPAPAGHGFDIFTTGLYLLPLAVGLLVVTYPVGVLITKVGAKPFLILGSIVGALGFFMISTATSAAEIAAYLAIGSMGLGILMVSQQNLLVLTVRTHEMGLATSMNTVFRNVGSSLGAPIAGSLIASYTATYLITTPAGKVHQVLPSLIAFQYSYYIAVGAFIVSLVLSLFAQEIMGKRAKIKDTLSDSPQVSAPSRASTKTE
ncbi:MAG: MFS transporter [Nitrososphaerales archaeon]